MLLANARLSERSSRGYCKIVPLAAEMMNSFAAVAAQPAVMANTGALDRHLALIDSYL